MASDAHATITKAVTALGKLAAEIPTASASAKTKRVAAY